MKHELKVEKQFFDAIVSGDKTFEVRYNDRGYQKGDVLQLKPWSPQHNCYIEPYNGIEREVTYVLSSYGLRDGFVCLGLKVL